MELTNDIIDMTYKFAWTFLKRKGRRDIDPNDLAHDAMVKLAKDSEVESRFIRHKVWLEIRSAYYNFYTNFTTRKHNVMLDAWHSPIEHAVWDENTVDAADEYKRALQQMYVSKPHWAELLADFRTMEAIAKERHVSPQAINEQKKHARQMLKSFMDAAA